MRNALFFFIFFSGLTSFYGQELPPKEAYPLDIRQIHSGHSLTDPLFGQPWPGQFVNLISELRGVWALDDIGKSTIPGSPMHWRWNNPPGHGAPDARHDIGDWELLVITERVALAYEGGNDAPWYQEEIQNQRDYLSRFVNNAWENGNGGNGAPTLLWTTWTNIDDSDGPWREMLDIQGEEWERMQDYANENRPADAPHVYLIPGHKMMAQLYDDIHEGIVPGIANINDFFSDNIHTNSLGDYAIAMIHYSCIFNTSPVGLTNDLMPDPPAGFQMPSPELALYLQNMIWEVVTSYPRTGVVDETTNLVEHTPFSHEIKIYPNPVLDILFVKRKAENLQTKKSIYNNLGQLVFRGYENKIDMSQLPAGMYILKLEGGYFMVQKQK